MSQVLSAPIVVTYENNMLTSKQSNWKWPDIQGLHEFTGNLIHSASWPVDYDWKGQRVAVIGNGSSGVQIVPAMQKGIFSHRQCGIGTH